MHVLLSHGVPVSSPQIITADERGALALAELYAPDSSELSVRAMMNTTVDGAIAGADGTSGSLSNPVDSFLFGVLRALTDMVVVGAATVRAEDYRRPAGRADLRSRRLRPSGEEYPAVAVLTTTGDVPESLEKEWPTFLVCPTENVEMVQARTHLPASHVIGADTISDLVNHLATRGFQAIQAEGGPSVLGRFLAEDLLDELCFTQSHLTVGGNSPRVITGDLVSRTWALQTLIVGDGATLQHYRRDRDGANGS